MLNYVELINKRAAFISSISLSSIPYWFQYSHYATPDIPYIFFILLSIYFIIKTNSKSNISQESYSFYWFYAGISFSIAFFLRSFMVFLPILGLVPYVYISLKRQKIKSIFYLIMGLAVGLIPTLINLYLSYQLFGNQSLESLSSFAKNQALSIDNSLISLLD